MKKAAFRLLPLALLGALAIAGSALFSQSASSNSPVGNKILAHKLAVELGTEKARGKEMPVSAGIMYTLYRRPGVLQQRAAQNPGAMRALGRVNHHGGDDLESGHRGMSERVPRPRDEEHAGQPGLLAPSTGGGDDPDESAERAQHHRRPERLADRLQPLRVRLELRRREAVGRQVPPFWQFMLLDGHTRTPAAIRRSRGTPAATRTSAASSSTSTAGPTRFSR